MPDSDSWIIKAIEKEAMTRAIAEYNSYPKTFNFRGYSEQQVYTIITMCEASKMINPSMDLKQLMEKLQ